MLSPIAEAIKKSGQVYFLVEINFNGQAERISTKDISVGNYHFSGKVLNGISIGTSQSPHPPGPHPPVIFFLISGSYDQYSTGA